MNDPAYGGSPAPKKGASVLTIVLAIIGAVALLGFGTCVAGAFWVSNKAKAALEGGGFTRESPPEVVTALAGPKKDYVGLWVSERGSRLALDERGRLAFVKAEGGMNESFRAPVAAFKGNDIELHLFVTVTIAVTEPPHQVDGKWRMTAKGIVFYRESADAGLGAADMDDSSDGG